MNSLPSNGAAADAAAQLHQPFKLAGNAPGPVIFFRSDLLSDLIAINASVDIVMGEVDR